MFLNVHCGLCAYMPSGPRIRINSHANSSLLNMVYSVSVFMVFRDSLMSSLILSVYIKMTLNSSLSCFYLPPQRIHKVLELQACHHAWPICGFCIS